MFSLFTPCFLAYTSGDHVGSSQVVGIPQYATAHVLQGDNGFHNYMAQASLIAVELPQCHCSCASQFAVGFLSSMAAEVTACA